MHERRALARHKTLFKGRIYFNNRLSSMDCIVRDVTAEGARLECSENVTLPEVFELYLANKDEYFRARVIWRRGSQLGISWKAEEGKDRVEPADDNPLAERLSKLEHAVAVLQRRLDALQEI
ncbi:MAG: PilZ domain-containing protein [Hyphomicrobiales bacterium]|nr:PilZ domain-containing protein [Hyphomicrobiales bacterium]